MRTYSERKPKTGRCGHRFTPTKQIQPYCPACEMKFKTGKAKVEDLNSLSRPALYTMAVGAFQTWGREVRDKDKKCYTCGKETKPFHFGHAFKKEHYRGMIFNELTARKQCDLCNIGLDGNEDEFHKRLTTELGKEAFNQLEWEAEATKDYRWSRLELIEKIKQYAQ